jgi:hypothetical protein
MGRIMLYRILLSEDVEWIELAQVKVQWWGSVTLQTNLWVPQFLYQLSDYGPLKKANYIFHLTKFLTLIACATAQAVIHSSLVMLGQVFW